MSTLLHLRWIRHSAVPLNSEPLQEEFLQTLASLASAIEVERAGDASERDHGELRSKFEKFTVH